ncbi:hypothetical protein JZX86_05735 [Agrobacterium rosae]|uniref:hypothetical protein n=1 Tax=Agrobacterium rosae TaxID=1972867 RepID=UPI0019D3FDCB|nr:hypothetical protein [Agrobacterium rosae]MBN7804864.1 hypothetical protein [Agrobacterium rosae]
MAGIQTKFAIGDVVYHASTRLDAKQHPCPDCKGERKWKAISPAGSEYDFSCPRCCSSFHGNSDLSLRYQAFSPAVSKLTIGSIRVDTADERGNSYMCVETGVGSGNVYYERDMFSTEDEALTVAKLKASEQDKGVEWVAKLYDKTLSLSDYEMNSAEREANRAIHSEKMNAICSFFDGLEWSDDVEAMRDAVSKFREVA